MFGDEKPVIKLLNYASPSYDCPVGKIELIMLADGF